MVEKQLLVTEAQVLQARGELFRPMSFPNQPVGHVDVVYSKGHSPAIFNGERHGDQFSNK